MLNYTKEGMDKLVQILGKDNANNAIKHLEGLSPEFSKCVVNTVYGVFATNSKLSGKTRELAIVCNILIRYLLFTPQNKNIGITADFLYTSLIKNS